MTSSTKIFMLTASGFVKFKSSAKGGEGIPTPSPLPATKANSQAKNTSGYFQFNFFTTFSLLANVKFLFWEK